MGIRPADCRRIEVRAIGISTLRGSSERRSHDSSRLRRNRGPIPFRRRKWSPSMKIPLLIWFRIRLALTRRSPAASATVRYSSRYGSR